MTTELIILKNKKKYNNVEKIKQIYFKAKISVVLPMKRTSSELTFQWKISLNYHPGYARLKKIWGGGGRIQMKFAISQGAI